MSDKLNLTPMETLFSNTIAPAELAKEIDEIMFNYSVSLIPDQSSSEHHAEQIGLLRHLRNALLQVSERTLIAVA